MHKVVNNYNEPYFDKYNGIFIKKIIILILKLSKKNSINILSEEYLKNNEHKELLNYALKKNKNKLSNIILNILRQLEYDGIKNELKICLRQNKEINKLNYSLSEEKVHEHFKSLFKDIFYTDFFGDVKIWTYLGEKYNRIIFHNNFKKNNHDLRVCPYCDIETIQLEGSPYIEHFLPKSKFPYLATNLYNLASSCRSCNESYEGKGVKVYNPVNNIYNKSIGEDIDFNFIISTTEKGIKLKTQDIRDENYLKLMQLEKRYNKERVISDIIKDIDSLSILKNRIGEDDKTLIKYIKSKPFYYVIKDYLKM